MRMRRREFLGVLGGAAAAWPFDARAQQPAMPVIGYLTTGTPEADAVPFLAAFRQGLGEIGYVEGQNVAIQYRWAEFHYDRLSAMAANLAQRPVAVIAAIGGTPTALAAKAVTSTVPIIFYLGIDPVKFGLVASLNRPGGNITGIAALQAELVAKRIELLREMVPTAALTALLVNPDNPYTESETRAVHDGARSLGLPPPHVLRASTASEFDAAFGRLAELRVGALIVSADLFLFSRREQLVALATRHTVPTMYPWHEYATAGGLMSYGPSLFEAYRLVGVYTGKILKGSKPGDLPVEQITKVDLVINLKTANASGLTFPLTFLGRANEVIE
jgi:putative ABC transport system substrate-binding protein